MADGFTFSSTGLESFSNLSEEEDESLSQATQVIFEINNNDEDE